jgi:G6PDH family F420-dependent oxidoreductase
MLSEALDIVAALFDGEGKVNHRGRHFRIESARLWDLPEERVPVGVAVSGSDSCRLAGIKADLMIATEPKRELVAMFDAAGGTDKPHIGQVALAYDVDRAAAVRRAHEQFRWFGLGWKVNSDLPNPDSFEGATELITPEQVAAQISCGPNVEEHVEKIKPFIEAGFSEIAIVQIGADMQAQFTQWAQRELLPSLRSLS